MSHEEKKAQLLSWLQTALELELATIPPYLMALLSIRLPGNRQAAELIRSVMIEEMLHLALVGNVMSAIGGSSRLGAKNVPSYPLTLEFEGKAFRDRRFPVNLAPFSEETVRTFMMIEAPQELVRQRAVALDLVIPGLTIGEFYLNILELIAELDGRVPGGIFTGEPARQLEQDFYWAGGGMIVPVHDMASAHQALGLVISQGEGAWGSAAASVGIRSGKALKLGHYFRFSEIYHKRLYDPADDPSGPPSGPPITVDYSAVHPMKTNPVAADYPEGSELARLNVAFNTRYSLMLRQVEEALNGSPRSLYSAIMNGMHSLPPLARSMLAIPIKGDPRGLNGCPTFEWSDAGTSDGTAA